VTDSTEARNGNGSRNRWFWSLVAIGIGQFAVFWAIFGYTDGLWRDCGLAASAGLATAAAWWALFARYAEGRAERLLRERLYAQQRQLGGELDHHRHMITEQVADTTRLWRDSALPDNVYGDANGVDLRLNRDLTEDLRKSTTYWFYGPSGAYVPARIKLRPDETRVKLEQVRMIVIDPRNELALEQATLDRRRLQRTTGSDAEIHQEIKDDIFLMLVGLWEFRNCVQGQIQVSYESAAVFKRAEIFDEAAYSSIIALSEGSDFPLTCAWKKGQPAYTTLSDEFVSRRFDSAFTITLATSRDTLGAHIRELEFDDSKIDEMVQRYRQTYLARMEEILPKAQALQLHLSLPNPTENGPLSEGTTCIATDRSGSTNS
jgi:hypothetical protein